MAKEFEVVIAEAIVSPEAHAKAPWGETRGNGREMVRTLQKARRRGNVYAGGV